MTSTLTKEIDFGFNSEWNVNDNVLKYYKIEGSCLPPTCESQNIDPSDAACGSGLVSGYRFTTVVAALNVADLCEKLKRNYLNPPIKSKIESIKLYSRPVYKEVEQSDACNKLTPQSFCEIPECLQFCVDFYLEVNAVVSTFYVGESINTIFLDRHITLSGNSSSFYQHETRLFFETSGFMSIYYNSTYEIEQLNYNFNSIGIIRLFNNSEYNVLDYIHHSEGNLTLNNTTYTESINYNFLSKGFISLYNLNEYRLNNLSHLEISGSSYFGVDYTHLSEGSLLLNSKFIYLSQNYNNSNNGYISLLSGNEFDSTSKGVITIIIDYHDTISGYEYGNIELPESDIQSINENIIAACGCGTLPGTLFLETNIFSNNLIEDFLTRNGLKNQDIIDLNYNSNKKRWLENIHFIGQGPSFQEVERWDFVFDLGCDEFNQDWSMNILIKRTKGQSTLYTNINFIFNDESFCNNFDVILNLNHNTESNLALTENGLVLESVVNDRINLFEDFKWKNDPEIKLIISTSKSSGNLLLYDISSLFPENDL